MIPIERDGVYERRRGVDCALDMPELRRSRSPPNRTGVERCRRIKLSGIHFRPGGNTERWSNQCDKLTPVAIQIAERCP